MKEKIIVFNGAVESEKNTTSAVLSGYIAQHLLHLKYDVEVFNIVNADLPILNLDSSTPPEPVQQMADLFTQAAVHIWLAPLYHGGIPGIMKNCLDWLEITAQRSRPYLTGIKVGLLCWADGSQAMQGINNMDAIAKALRAWTLPYSIPIVKGDLLDNNNPAEIRIFYQNKINRLLHLATSTRIITP